MDQPLKSPGQSSLEDAFHHLFELSRNLPAPSLAERLDRLTRLRAAIGWPTSIRPMAAKSRGWKRCCGLCRRGSSLRGALATKQSIEVAKRKNGLLRRFAPRNDDGAT
jgi:hypothetical protein